MERERIRTAVEILWSHCALEEEPWEAELRKAGYSEVEARLLVSVVPEAFAVPVWERLGGSAPRTIVVNRRSGGHVMVALAEWPVFAEALALARAKFQTGPRDAYQRVAGRSAAMEVANRILQGGGDLKGTTSAPVLLGPYAEDLGPLPQYGVSTLDKAEAKRLVTLITWAVALTGLLLGPLMIACPSWPFRLGGLLLLCPLPVLLYRTLRLRRPGREGPKVLSPADAPAPLVEPMHGPTTSRAFCQALNALRPGWEVTERGIAGPEGALVRLAQSHESGAVGHVDVAFMLDETAARPRVLWDCVGGPGADPLARAAAAAHLWPRPRPAPSWSSSTPGAGTWPLTTGEATRAAFGAGTPFTLPSSATGTGRTATP